MFVEAEGGNIAVTGGKSMIEGNGTEAVEQILDACVGRDDVVLADLTEEAVGFVAPSERYDDIATQLVIQTQLKRVREHAARTGLRGFGYKLFCLEVDIEQ